MAADTNHADRDSGEVVEHPARGLGATVKRGPDPRMIADEPPKIGRYRVTRTLGRGSYGVVYEALDTQLERKIALKVLPSQDAAAELDLLREARAIAKLTHPNVVTVHEVGTTEDGRLYITMELIQGENLRTWMARGGHSVDDVVSKYTQAGQGLAAIHRAGLVHGDFKPANVLVGEDGRVRVVDFGLARLHDGGGGGVGGWSASGSGDKEPEEGTADSGAEFETGPLGPGLQGTPAYMAPEQHRGRATDARSDQFSFCVALFQGVYGWHPFPALTYGELVERVLNGKVRIPDRAEGGAWVLSAGPRAPAWLQRVLLRGMSVDPQERWPSMEALVSELQRDRSRLWRGATLAAGMVGFLVAGYFGGEHVRGRVPELCAVSENQVQQIWGPARQAQVRESILATELPYASDTWSRAEALLGSYLTTWDALREETCQTATQEDSGSATEGDGRLRCLGQRFVEVGALIDVLAQADDAVVEHAVEAIADLNSPRKCSREDPAFEPAEATDPETMEKVDALRARLARAEALRRTGLYVDGIRLGHDIMEEARTLSFPPIDAEARLEYARLLQKSGRFSEAADQFEAATFLAEGARHDGVAAEAAVEALLSVGYHLGRPDDAMAWRPEAEVAVARLGTETLVEADLLKNVGYVFQAKGEYAAARANFERSLALKQKRLPPEHPQLARTYSSLGTAAEEQGDLDKAEFYGKRALVIFRQSLGEQHPLVALGHYNLGEVYLRWDALDTAAEHGEKARELWSSLLHDEHPNLGYAQLLQAEIALARGEFDAASQGAERAIALLSGRDTGLEEPIGRAWRVKGAALVGRGDLKAAVETLERAVKLLGDQHSPGQAALARLELAQTLRKLGESGERALELATNARRSLSGLGDGWARFLAEADAFIAAERVDDI